MRKDKCVWGGGVEGGRLKPGGEEDRGRGGEGSQGLGRSRLSHQDIGFESLSQSQGNTARP